MTELSEMNTRSVARDENIRLKNGKTALLSAVQLSASTYEVMLLDPKTGHDYDCIRCFSEEEAKQHFDQMRKKHHVPEGEKPQDLELKGKYKQLSEDLKEALAYGLAHAGAKDGGTCNMDAPMLYLPRWNTELVKAAAKAAGTHASKWRLYGTNCYVFGIPGAGQGDRRSNAAEAMYEFLKEKGYEASVYYQMD